MTPHTKHLIIAALVAAFALYAVAKVTAHFDGVAHDQRVLAEAQLAQDKKAQVAADAQAQKDRQAYDLLKTQLDSQNAQLRGQIAALAASLSVQQAKDRALPPPELAERWVGLIGGVPGDVKPVPDGLVASLAASRQTVVMLEEVPSLKAQNDNLNTIIGNNAKQLQSLTTRAESAEKAGEACKKTLATAEDTCNKQKQDIKDQARKGKWKAFGAGAAVALAAVARIFL